MSIRYMSGGFAGMMFAVSALVFVAGCGEDQTTSLDTTPPAVPGGLRASSNYSDIYLRWQANSENDLAGYNVYSSVDGGALELVAVLPPTSTKFRQTCERDHLYGYELTAVDQSANESAPSPQVRITHSSRAGGGRTIPVLEDHPSLGSTDYPGER